MDYRSLNCRRHDSERYTINYVIARVIFYNVTRNRIAARLTQFIIIKVIPDQTSWKRVSTYICITTFLIYNSVYI